MEAHSIPKCENQLFPRLRGKEVYRMKPKHHTHLSLSERHQIYVLLGRKVPLSQIASVLGRHHSTIYREVQRNTYWDDDIHYNCNQKKCIKFNHQNILNIFRPVQCRFTPQKSLNLFYRSSSIIDVRGHQEFQHPAPTCSPFLV